VDLQGRLSNPPYNFGRALDKLVPILARPEPSSLPDVPSLQLQHRPLPRETDALLNAYNDGRSIEQLAREFRLHRTTVMDVLNRNGAPRRPIGPKLDAEATLRAAALYVSGQSLKDVAAQFGVNPTTVGNSLKRSGVPLRPRRGWQDTRRGTAEPAPTI